MFPYFDLSTLAEERFKGNWSSWHAWVRDMNEYIWQVMHIIDINVQEKHSVSYSLHNAVQQFNITVPNANSIGDLTIKIYRNVRKFNAHCHLYAGNMELY